MYGTQHALNILQKPHNSPLSYRRRSLSSQQPAVRHRNLNPVQFPSTRVATHHPVSYAEGPGLQSRSADRLFWDLLLLSSVDMEKCHDNILNYATTADLPIPDTHHLTNSRYSPPYQFPILTTLPIPHTHHLTNSRYSPPYQFPILTTLPIPDNHHLTNSRYSPPYHITIRELTWQKLSTQITFETLRLTLY